MRSDSFRRLAAAAGLASVSAVAGAQIPGEVTVPLGSSYGANCPTGTCPGSYGDVSGVAGAYGTQGVVYGSHGGVFTAAANNGYPPSRYPVDRIPVQYLRYYPAVWYGLPGSTLPVVAPQVFMPTDTTQFGFYYQRVPTWVPVPGMVPGPPNPAMLHSYGGAGVTGAAINGTTPVGITDGSAVNGTATNERIISVRPLTTSSSKAPEHTATGETPTAPNVVPTPPAPAGGSRLPLQPPTAPPSEPNAFVPPPAPAPLVPVSKEDGAI